VLKIKDQTNLRLALIIYDDKEVQLSNRHQYNLRNNLNAPLTTVMFNYINKIREEAIIIWNALPNNIKEIQRRDRFKEEITKYKIYFY